MASKIALSIFCLAFVAYTQATPVIQAGTHDIYQCADPTKATVTLLDKTVEVSGSFYAVHKETINYPESRVPTQKISCIIIENELGDDGGYVTLETNTGVGYYISKIYLESQRGKAMKFHIQIFAEEGGETTTKK